MVRTAESADNIRHVWFTGSGVGTIRWPRFTASSVRLASLAQ